MATERYQPQETPRPQQPHRPPAPHSRDKSSKPDAPASDGAAATPRPGTEPRLSAGHRRDHRDLTARWHGRVQSLREPYVLLAGVDVDEPAQLAALVQDP